MEEFLILRKSKEKVNATLTNKNITDPWDLILGIAAIINIIEKGTGTDKKTILEVISEIVNKDEEFKNKKGEN